MRIAVMQPTYLPWMGYFGMIELADVFVFYDDVQFQRQSWQSRNKIKLSNHSKKDWQWLSVPIIHDGLDNKIKQVKINNNNRWKDKHWKTIYHSYNNTEFFSKYEEKIKSFYNPNWQYIANLNIYIIKKLSRLFNLDLPEFIVSSELEGIKGNKTDRLINIINKLEAKEYISPSGAKDYLERDKFKKNGKKLYWYEYNHPVYEQIGEDFLSHMSAIDLLFNVGDDSKSYIRKGLKNAIIKD